MKRIKFLPLVLFIIGSELLGSLGSIATMPAIPTWFKTLNKPPLQPPNWIFGPVWTFLFFMMGVSAYLIWQQGTKKQTVKYALELFVLQFGLNILWSFLFFGLQSPFWAGICILCLWTAIYITMQAFKKINTFAMTLLIPYLLWVTFATYLNWGVAFLN